MDANDRLFESMRSCEGLDIAVVPDGSIVDASWCLRFLRAIRDVSFATIDGTGLPSVRIIDVMAVTPDQLFFLAPRGKMFHEDIMRERFVAIVGQTSDYRTCRLRGRVVRPEGENAQHALVDALFELNPSMNLIYPGDARYICDAFCLCEGEGEYFDLGQRPIFRQSFDLGGHKKDHEGLFVVNGNCNGCGICASVCPEQCVRVGSPSVIDQAHCLRCGLCKEACPQRAIRRKC